VLAGLAVSATAPRADAQELPPRPVFDEPDNACGKGALLSNGNVFVLNYDGSLAPDASRRYRFHFDGSSRASLDGGDKLPQKLGTVRTVEIGTGKTIHLNVTGPVFARLRAYDAQGRESEPANLTLLPLSPPSQLLVSSGSNPTLSWVHTFPNAPELDPLIEAKGYQVFRFACNVESTAICSTQAGTMLGETATAAFQDDSAGNSQYRYGVRAFVRFNDGSPTIVSPAVVSQPCDCAPVPVQLTASGIEGKENGSAKFTLPKPITSSATLTVGGTVCWNNSADCALSRVTPGGTSFCENQPDCMGLPLPTSNLAAFFFRVGSGGPAQVAMGTNPTVTFTLPGLPAGTDIYLWVNDADTSNNAEGFTVDLSYTSTPQCSSQ
jgi:hypothetical protein